MFFACAGQSFFDLRLYQLFQCQGDFGVATINRQLPFGSPTVRGCCGAAVSEAVPLVLLGIGGEGVEVVPICVSVATHRKGLVIFRFFDLFAGVVQAGVFGADKINAGILNRIAILIHHAEGNLDRVCLRGLPVALLVPDQRDLAVLGLYFFRCKRVFLGALLIVSGIDGMVVWKSCRSSILA